jgi:hypothetical protein
MLGFFPFFLGPVDLDEVASDDSALFIEGDLDGVVIAPPVFDRYGAAVRLRRQFLVRQPPFRD